MPNPVTLNAAYIRERVTVTEAGCWEWQRSKIGAYGKATAGLRQLGEQLAHRISWIIYRGPIPMNMEICHDCDNPGCCNPDHLFIGTHQHNMQDARRKNRINYEKFSAKGVISRRFSLEKAQEIMKLYKEGVPRVELAKRYNTSTTMIHNIIHNKHNYRN